jgi:energy-coupling factor transport system ATP-binding protein
LIKLNNVSYRYKGCREWVLRDIDLRIEEGDFLLLCGGSGSGKSTLAYVLSGLIPHFLGGELKGEVAFQGIDTASMSISDFLSRVGLIFQNSDAQLFNGTVEEEMAFGLEAMGLAEAEIERRIKEVAHALGIESMMDRSPMHVSGGEKRLVAIASVLCLNPHVLILDEPFSNLDWAGGARLRQVLVGLNRSGRTVILVEQRLGQIIKDVSRCVIMENGRIIFDGPPVSSRHYLEKARLLPQYPPKTHNTQSGETLPVVSVRNLYHRKIDRDILHDISMDVRRGEILAILGKNGAGKTTLARHLNGLLKPQRGEVRVDGVRVSQKKSPEMAKWVGISFQNPSDQFFKNTVREELVVGISRSGANPEKRLEELGELFGLKDLMDRSPHLLSEGQKKRTAVASILAMDPRVLVLDEPTIGQDGRFLETMARVLAALRRKGQTVVMVTHDLEFARATADRWIMLDEGRVVGGGSAADDFKAVVVNETP